jgi:hypothetical protein
MRSSLLPPPAIVVTFCPRCKRVGSASRLKVKDLLAPYCAECPGNQVLAHVRYRLVETRPQALKQSIYGTPERARRPRRRRTG